MKTTVIKFLSLFAFAALFSLNISCSGDDNITDPSTTGGGNGGNGGDGGNPPAMGTELTGMLTEDLTLDPNVSYILDDTYSVESGVTLTIPAGTTITANAVQGENTSTYIVIQQGAQIDIQGTAANPVIMTSNNATPGDWGGLVILGSAPTTAGVNVTAEVGQLQYGGTVNDDNSGSINYLIINYAGAAINPDSQFNGLTLYAVGSGTSISNVAMINGTDDGVEFFGGTVSASNMYFENNEDDAIDWTEGWNGTLTNGYVLHTIEGFSTAVEADGENGNPTLTNITAISNTGGTALQFKRESGATITGLSLAGYDTSLDFRDMGAFSNVQIEGQDADPTETYIAAPSVDVAMFDWINSTSEVTTTVLSGSIDADMTLDASVNYLLSNTFSVNNGATLTIPAGTTITADAVDGQNTSTYIVIQQGAQIDVQGTATNPVIMTSNGETPGDWGGLVILGDATTTAGVNVTAEVGQLQYGGTNDSDNSGSINYLVINYAGAAINPDSQFNGLTLYAVGSETTISNVAMLNGTDDGVEFFGGTVSATNMYFQDNEDDSIDWTEGWNGTLTNAYVVHNIDGFSTAVEADGENGNPTLTNITAISSTGGTALQFKRESGATITGLSLAGYTTSLDFRDGGAVSNVQIEGADSDPAEAYEVAATVDVALFSWVPGI